MISALAIAALAQADITENATEAETQLVTAFSAEPFTQWFSWLYLVALAMVVFTVVKWVIPLCRIIRKEGFRKSFRDSGTVSILLLSLLFIYLSYMMVHAGLTDVFEKYEWSAMYEKGEYETVEGYITSYSPLSSQSDGRESFTVGEVTFTFDADEADVYHYAQCRRDGGILKEGMYVRIHYIPTKHGGYILRVDTAQ